MESVSETRLLALFGGERLDRLQIEVVIKMQVRQVLPVNKQVQHVVTLSADLQTRFNPINLGLLEELGALQRPHQILLILCLWWLLVQLVQDKSL